ncbi:hypothetical protein HJB72_01595 [Rhizobium lentis]|uniref:hypothetical protein n=1 Tax=Rhizobium lentis TaxID=1138194 RepID=UPI001C83CF70|nr:hypothetical protein [Rhizobium lentis]MBX4996685.1 hypothetical protein [Rhizobium lentis]
MKCKPANDNSPRIAESKSTGQPLPERTPAERHEARATVKAKVKEEGKALTMFKRRLAKRNKPSDDWDGKADNDNPSLPIIKALLAEGNNDLLPALLLYRRVEAAATSGAELVGNAVGTEPLQAEQDLWMDEKTGAIQRKGQKQSKAKDAQPWRAQAIDVFRWTYTKQLPAHVPTKWNGDAKVIARIDGVKQLAEFRASLGPLAQPFEEAAIHGATLEKVGMMAGATSSRSAMAVGRAVIHMALSVIRDRAGPITYNELKEIAA